MRQDLTESEAMQQWMQTNESVLGHLTPEQRKAHHDLERAIGRSRRRRAMKRRTRIVMLTLLGLLVISLIGLSVTSSSAKAATASCFGPGLWGNPMANGRTLNHDTVAIAHKTLPLGTVLAVKWRGNVVQATVQDRGPFVRGRQLDLTMRLTQVLTRSNRTTCRTWGVRQVLTWIVRPRPVRPSSHDDPPGAFR